MMKLEKILFIGDSITDCGRRGPGANPLGNGYVYFIANWLFAKYPELEINVLNHGIDGNNIRNLQARWQTDCIEVAPDVVSVLIGINDVWRRHRGPERLPDAVLPDEYLATYCQLLTDVTAKLNCQIVLVEPFLFCSDDANAVLQDLHAYRNIVSDLACKFNAIHVPMQNNLNAMMRKVPSAKWSSDMVHPYTWAHAWIAQQWLACTKL